MPDSSRDPWYVRWMDARFLSRVSNVQTAVRLAGLVGLLVAALVGGIIDAATHLAKVWVVLIAIAILGLVFEGGRHGFARVTRRRVSRGSDGVLVEEATTMASVISGILADHKLDEPDPWDPSEDPVGQGGHKAWARRVNASRRAENRALTKYLHQAPQIFVISNELRRRDALTDEELDSIIHAGATIHWLDRVPGLLLLGARRLRDKGAS